jgi:hypothetical protein
MDGQVRRVVGIARDHVRPALLHVLALLLEARALLRHVIMTAASTLVVVEFGMWCPDVSVASLANLETEVDIVVGQSSTVFPAAAFRHAAYRW